jgi:hypothetical protein
MHAIPGWCAEHSVICTHFPNWQNSPNSCTHCDGLVIGGTIDTNVHGTAPKRSDYSAAFLLLMYLQCSCVVLLPAAAIAT